jgi:hypothetical protein
VKGIWQKVFKEWIRVKVKNQKVWNGTTLTFDVDSNLKKDLISEEKSELENMKNNKNTEFWLQEGEEKYITERIFGNVKDIEKLKNFSFEQSDNVGESRTFRFDPQDSADLIWILFQNDFGDYAEMLQKDVNFILFETNSLVILELFCNFHH